MPAITNTGSGAITITQPSSSTFYVPSLTHSGGATINLGSVIIDNLVISGFPVGTVNIDGNSTIRDFTSSGNGAFIVNQNNNVVIITQFTGSFTHGSSGSVTINGAASFAQPITHTNG